MGVFLINNYDQHEQINWRVWYCILYLGKSQGWVPLGTQPPDGVEGDMKWDGGYDSNDGQRVSAEDADALAAALERSLACGPNQEPYAGYEPCAAAGWSSEERECLGRWIAYFRQGEFFIC